MKQVISTISPRNILFAFATAAFVFLMPYNGIAKVKSKKTVINTDNGAQIYVNGTLMATTTIPELKVEAYANLLVRVEKPGFISQELTLINDDNHEIQKSYFIKLEVDDAFEQSSTSQVVNTDIDIKTSLKEDDAWKLIGRIVQGSFDVMEVTDKSTGYMRTAWVVKNFKSATIRTRLFIKTGSSDPLIYKAKLVSEIGKPGASASSDEGFKPWDRVLRTYENLVPDLQSRVGK